MKTDTEYYFRGNSRGQRDRGKPKEIKRLLNNLVVARGWGSERRKEIDEGY